MLRIALSLIFFLVSCVPYTPNVFIESKAGVYYAYGNSRLSGGGTGFVIKGKSGKRVFVTNAHVCEGTEDSKLYVTQDGSKVIQVLPIIKIERLADLCTAEAPNGGKTLTLAHDAPKNYSKATVVGHPHLEHIRPYSGLLLDVKVIQVPIHYGPCTDNEPPFKTIQIPFLFAMVDACVIEREGHEMSTIIYPGNSGSPVLNDSAEVVGVAFAGNGMTSFMVPYNQLKRLLEDA